MAVAFDAVGGGVAQASWGTSTRTWSHTVASGNNVCILVFISLARGVATNAWMGTGLPNPVTFGGQAMTYAGAITNNNTTTTNGCVYVFTLMNPTNRGTQTVSVTGNLTSVNGWANSVSYTGVSIPSLAASYGASGNPNISIPTSVDHTVVAVLGILDRTVTTLYGNERYIQSAASGTIESGIIADSNWFGSSPINLQMTPSSANSWAAIGINLFAAQQGDTSTTATASATASISLGARSGANSTATAATTADLTKTVNPSASLTATAASSAVAGYGVTAATVVTASRTATLSQVATAGAATAATATFSASETRNALVAASITATATPAASGGRGQFLSASLTATGDSGTPQPLYNAGAFSSLFVNSLFSATGLRTLIGVANLTSTAAAVANITEFGVATASITATAARTGNLVSNQRFDSNVTGTASASGALSRGQSIDATGITATGSTSGALSYGASAGANLISTALFSSAIVKIRLLSGSLTVTAVTTVDMSENTVAQASLTATAAPSAALTKTLNAASSLTAIALPAAALSANRRMQAALAVVAYREALIDEPREIIYVEADNRKASVESVYRKAYINEYDRYASVPAYSDRTAKVETTEVSQAISRDALDDFRGLFFWFIELPLVRSSSRSYQIVDDDRSVSVEAEDRDALVPATRPESLLK